MADKLIKAFEALRIHYVHSLTIGHEPVLAQSAQDGGQKKKDHLLGLRERISYCNTISDFLPLNSIRELSDFPKLLSISIELLLWACDDNEADVRLVAGECINKIIKAFLDTNIGRIQVELYKEIKKNGPVRPLKAAMQRFCDTCHMIRAQKCRPYVANLLPCLVKIAKRTDESIQEALGQLMVKLCPVLGPFFSEDDVKILLKTFIPNLKSSFAVARRTGACSLNAVCEFSRNPGKSYSWLINVLLGLVVPLNDDQKSITILGALMCFRQLIPNLESSNSKEHTLKGSFGRTLASPQEKGMGKSLITEKQLLQIYEVALFCTKNKDHNIVTSALEVLQQLLLTKPQALVNILLSPDGISPSVSSQTAESQGESELDTVEEGNLKTEVNDYALDDDLQSVTDASSRSELTESGLSEDGGSMGSTEMTLEQGIQSLGDKLVKFMDKPSVKFEANEGSRDSDSVEQGEEANEEEDALLLPRTYTQASRTSAVSDLPEVDLENMDIEEFLRNNSVTSYEAAVAIERHFNIDAVACTGVPILHCIRLMCSFLLEGQPGSVLSDANTRVSVKSLSLSCISHALTMYPEALLAYVLPDSESKKEGTGAGRQGIRDVLLLLLHSDPQIRGNVALMAGSFLKGALLSARGNYDSWCTEVTRKYETEFLPIASLINAIKSVLCDESAIANKMACSSFKHCIEELCRSSYGHYTLELIRQTLNLRQSLYWLTKVELMETLATVDFRLLHVIELKAREGDLHNSTNFRKFSGLQEEVLDTVFLTFLGDEDARVRLAASQCLVNLVANLSFVQCGSLRTLQQEVFFYQGARNGVASIKHTADSVQFFMENKSMLMANLSNVTGKIIARLNQSTTKFLTHGCCQALAFLSEMYPIALCLSAWEILPSFTLNVQPTFRDRTLSVFKSGSPRRLRNGEVFGGSIGSLAAAFSLITTTWMTSDLQAHQVVLKFCVNTLLGASSQRLQEIAKLRKENPGVENVDAFGGVLEDGWGILRDGTLVSYASRLFQHCMRLLCMITHVIEQTNPSGTSSKLQISFSGGKERSSTPVPGTVTPTSQQQGHTSAPSSSHTTSPRKFLLGRGSQRRTMSEVDLAAYERSPVGKVMDRTSGTKTTESISPSTHGSDSKLSASDSQQSLNDKLDKFGSFHHMAHLMKTYDVLKGSYKNYQVTPVGKRKDKFFTFVHGVLESFSLLLELATFGEVGGCAEEILEYLQSTVKVASEITFLAVQQLLKGLFGTNAGTHPESYLLPYSTKHLVETRGDPTFWINSRPKVQAQHSLKLSTRSGIYDNFFQRMLQPLSGAFSCDFLKTASSEDGSTEKSSFSLFKRFRKPTALPKPASKLNKEKVTSIQSYIRLFEPLVIHALKTYTMTSSLNIQCQVIHLLDQLIHLRVNYSLLDADQIFIGYVLKQFEFVESGQIRLPQVFVPEVFQFLVLLSYECFQPKFTQAKAIISMPQIIQLCDGLMACGQPATTNAIPALQPIVHDLFVARGQGRPDSRKELDTQREVVVSMLTRLIQFPKVIGMMVTVLEGSKEDDEKWRRLSRQFIDMLFPMLASLGVYVDSEEDMDIIHRLLDSVAQVAIRPADIILKTLFTPIKLVSLTDSLRWLTMVISMTRALFYQNSEDVILSRLQVVNICSVPDLFIKDVENAEKAWFPNESRGFTSEDHAYHIILYMMQAILVGAEEIRTGAGNPNVSRHRLNFLTRLEDQLLTIFIAVLESDNYPRLLAACKDLVHTWTVFDSQQEIKTKSLVHMITSTLLSLQDLTPSSMLLWLHVLKTASFSDQEWWHRFIVGTRKGRGQLRGHEAAKDAVDNDTLWSEGLVSAGGLVLYCQFLYDRLKKEKSRDIGDVCLLLKAAPEELLEQEHEEPVNNLLSYVCDDAELSGLFIQIVSQMFCEDSTWKKEKLWSSVLRSLENVHLSQSTKLLQLLFTLIPKVTLQGLARKSETLACRRLQYILSLPANLRNSGMPYKELQLFLEHKVNETRYPCLYTLSLKATEVKQSKQMDASAKGLTDPLGVEASAGEEPTITKDWLTLFAENICQSKRGWTTDQISVCVELIKVLDSDDLKTVLESKNFDMQLLVHCLASSCQDVCNASRSIPEFRGEELTTSVDLSSSLSNNRQLRLLHFGITVLLRRVQAITSMAVKNIATLDITDQNPSLKDIKFTLVSEDVVVELSSDDSRWENILLLNKCLTIFLAPCCYQNRRWRLESDEVVSFLYFAFISLLTCRYRVQRVGITHMELNMCLESIATVLHAREFWDELVAKEQAALVAAGIDDLYTILVQVALQPGQKLAPEVLPYYALANGVEGYSKFARACEKISELVHSLRTHFRLPENKEFAPLPRYLIMTVRRLIIGMARHPLVNSHARVPPLVWKMGWMPKGEGIFKTELPPLPIDILKEKDVLTEFVLRVNLLGWISRPQFEETWAALLGVLSSPPVSDDTAVEEEIEAAQSSCLAVHCITSLLLDTTLAPVPGNSAISRHSVIHRQRDYPFVGSRAGKKLSSIRRMIENEYKSLLLCDHGQLAQLTSRDFLYPVVPSLLAAKQRKQQLYHGCLMEDKLFSSNLEFSPGLQGYALGQISANAIRLRLVTSDVQEDTDSDDSEALIIQLKDNDVTSNKVEELDIRSCLQFLLELFEQWLSPYIIPKTPLMMKTEAVKSLCLLSDLLLELNHFEWILGILLEFYTTHPAEDDILNQYLVPTICKACAVLKLEGQMTEKVCKIVETVLRSPHVPLQVSGIVGGLYLMESQVASTTALIVPILTDFLTKHITTPSDDLDVLSQRFSVLVWSASFYIVELCATDIQDTLFVQNVIETAMVNLADPHSHLPSFLANTLLRGLERLVVSFSLTRTDCDRIAKLMVRCLSADHPDRFASTLGLLCTCMYTGKEGEHPSGLSNPEPAIDSPITDSRLVVMERLGALITRSDYHPHYYADLTFFTSWKQYSPQVYKRLLKFGILSLEHRILFTLVIKRPLRNDVEICWRPALMNAMQQRNLDELPLIRKGSSREGTLIAKILPIMLTDFLPVQEIMNKVISEFLSSQQPKPELIARTAYETFDLLHRQGQQETLRDWILLSLGSFLQRTPLAMAVWSISCFFVSVSTNQWIHALFPYVLSRKGKLEADDKRIFCMVSMDFYRHQNLDDVQKRMFLNTFQAKVDLSPYQELVAQCTRLN